MTIDIEAWREVLSAAVAAVADEDLQRRSWFGLGPEQSSPDETVNQLIDDAALPEFLARSDNGLSERQLSLGLRLSEAIDKFARNSPRHLVADDVVDDPRWREVRQVARQFLGALGDSAGQ